MKIGVATKPKLFLNYIKDLRIGIHSISADPFIYRNLIADCNTGILSSVYEQYYNETRIKINEIRNCKEDGIVIKGVNNHTVVKNNTAIKSNKKAGIRVEEGARARITMNKISNNLHQGILVVEKSSAFIEGNYIYQNIKANIAFGGDSSENTIISKNKIFNSASEGIFIMMAGKCIIMSNEIYGNYDGISIIESVPELSFNNIFRNRNNGMLVMRGSMLNMRENNVYENEGVGLVLREKSFGKFVKNIVLDNEMDLAVEYETPDLNQIFIDNQIGKDRRIPVKSSCNLI